jgi:hypothetical protein
VARANSTLQQNLNDEDSLVLQMRELEAIEREQELNSNATDSDVPSLLSGKSSEESSLDLEGRQ